MTKPADREAAAPTPRTDELQNSWQGGTTMSAPEWAQKALKLARQLERELAAAHTIRGFNAEIVRLTDALTAAQARALPEGMVAVPKDDLVSLIGKLDECLQVYPSTEEEHGGFATQWDYDAAQLIRHFHVLLAAAQGEQK